MTGAETDSPSPTSGSPADCVHGVDGPVGRTDDELLRDYWAAHAQFGPFDVGPREYLKMVRVDRIAATCVRLLLVLLEEENALTPGVNFMQRVRVYLEDRGEYLRRRGRWGSTLAEDGVWWREGR